MTSDGTAIRPVFRQLQHGPSLNQNCEI